MKRFLSNAFFLALICASAYFIYRSFPVNPCKQTLGYSIGRFDTQFGISQEDFKKNIAEAEKVWEKELGRDVFAYDPEATFKINLIYDERQLETVQKQKTEFGLSAVENVFKKLDAEFSLFKERYDSKVAAYENSLALFQRRKSAYDEKVLDWNKKGGAPRSVFNTLEAERLYLSSEASRLNAEVSAINVMTNQLNALLQERNIKASEYNRMAESYNEKYNGGMEFNQAEYNGVEINVYQFSDKKDLIVALTHEFGHALNMDHVENPKSVMYYLTGANVEVTPTLSAEDLAELNRVCNI